MRVAWTATVIVHLRTTSCTVYMFIIPMHDSDWSHANNGTDIDGPKNHGVEMPDLTMTDLTN